MAQTNVSTSSGQQNELDFLNELDNEIADSSKFITIRQDETKRLRFVLRERPPFKEDTFKGELTGVWKTFYTAVDVNSTNQNERTFKANKRSTQLINEQLKQRHYVLDITHEGTGKDTVYRPTAV